MNSLTKAVLFKFGSIVVSSCLINQYHFDNKQLSFRFLNEKILFSFNVWRQTKFWIFIQMNQKKMHLMRVVFAALLTYITA